MSTTSVLLSPPSYVSIMRLGGIPLLPPLMTAEKRQEASLWREKALLVAERLPKEKYHEESSLLDAVEEDSSPMLSAYASRFGSLIQGRAYLSGLSPKALTDQRQSKKVSPPLPPKSPSRDSLRSSISELDRERDEAVQRFLEEQSRSLVALKKSFAEQRKKLLRELKATTEGPKKQGGAALLLASSRLSIRQKKAFSLLPSLVKGYLVRRLMSTLKVQHILTSLKDTLKMALQLHQEAARCQRSSESDVNLHKNLLQQINRDVSRFHAIFFEQTVGEKMKMIALDREERKKEKPKEKKFLSEATKQRIKSKMGGETHNKENNKPKSPSTLSREKTTSPQRRVISSNKASPRTKKSVKIHS